MKTNDLTLDKQRSAHRQRGAREDRGSLKATRVLDLDTEEDESCTLGDNGSLKTTRVVDLETMET